MTEALVAPEDTANAACDGGEAILEAFRRLRVDYVITSPGSEWAPVWEAFARQQLAGTPGPVFMDCWHETLAVDIALGYARVTGRLQAVLLHAGAGLLQGMMGIHSALQAEAPLLLLSGESLTYGEDASVEPGGQWYQSLSVVGGPQRLVEPLAKWATQAGSVHTLHAMVLRAGELAQRPPCGPTYLNVPLEVMLAGWTPPARRRPVPPAPKPRPAQADIEHVAELLATARSPVISSDAIGRDPAGMEALVELAELLGAPVLDGRACAYANFPKDHPLYLGWNLDGALAAADVVLLAKDRVPWYPPHARPEATVVAVDEAPLKSYMVYQNLDVDHYLEGDAVSTLRLLTAAVRASGVDASRRDERVREIARQHAAQAAALRAAEERVAPEAPIEPLALVKALNETLPDDAVYVDELILHRPLARRHLRWNRPQSYFHSYGGLGQGLGLALGVKLALPERPTVLLIGDGSFLYNPAAQALGASRRYGLPILVVVFDNRAYGVMRKNHLDFYPGGVAATNDLWHGVHIDGPDYAGFARLFDMHGERVETAARLQPALAEALAAVQAGTTAIVSVALRA